MLYALYGDLLFIGMALIIVTVSLLTLRGSWKQGNFSAASISVSTFLFGAAALAHRLGVGDISMILFVGSVLAFFFSIFVVAPMAFRRSRKRRTPKPT